MTFEKGQRVTVFAPGDEFDGRKGFVEHATHEYVAVSFGGAIAYSFDHDELREGW